MKQFFGLAVLFAVLSVTAGCQDIKPIAGSGSADDSVKELQQALEHNQQQAEANNAAETVALPNLLPPLSIPGRRERKVEERFDLTSEALDARDFFMNLVQGTGYNMIVHEKVGGSVSLNLKNVTVDEVMQAVRRVYGYEYRKTGNLYQVLPAELQSEIFQINYLDIKREGVSDTRVSGGSVGNASSSDSGDSDDSDSSSDSGGSGSGVSGTRIRTSTTTDFWSGLELTLSALVRGEGRQVVINRQTGIVVVHALPGELELVRNYLKRSELILHRQVILEAKVLEITLNNRFQTGINWSLVADESNGDFLEVGLSSAALTNPDNIAGVFRAGVGENGAFTDVLELLGTQGDVQVLSSPRVSTVNNQKAVIKVGTDEFFVTEVENTTTTGTSTTTTPKVELTAFFSGIALDVTPQISGDGTIILHIHPTVSEVQDQQKFIDIGSDTFTLPTAFSSVRESDSVVKADSGQVIVIGGLMKSSNQDTNASVPWFGDIPGVGELFKQKRQRGEKTELVILLRPVLADQKGWRDELQRSLETFEALRQTSSEGSY
ncbi:pilus (MSHA type) biogenesis protein MshL [Marinobacterium jannaschii]|uniref:pilus (MSHA type) biogenesis protein MshL n=1 Tax=Marinobacterium jannaschii TaxID=64970 RepID=UPI000562057F|nr:pilus (MSHA type) biogenesis protein MshL [Marinobacterium jannaschii]